MLTREVRDELTAYHMSAGSAAGWEETRLWCSVCGRRRLLGPYGVRGGELWLRCPDCCVGSNDYYSYTPDREILGGGRGYQRAHGPVPAWVGRLHPAALRRHRRPS